MIEVQRRSYAFYDGGPSTGFSGLTISATPLTTTFERATKFISVSNIGDVEMYCSLLTSKETVDDVYPAYTDDHKTISLSGGEKFSDNISADGVIIKTFGGETKAKIYVSW